jgi:hypothetical protein
MPSLFGGGSMTPLRAARNAGILLLACLSASCQPAAEPRPFKDAQTYRDARRSVHEVRIHPILKRLAAENRVEVFEGLPHQFDEAELLEAELARKETVNIGGFPFYAEPISVDSRTLESIAAGCRSPASYAPWSGLKLCGGFHPDWCVTFGEGETSWHLLICFGCRELKLLASENDEYDCDLSAEGLFVLSEVRSLRRNRP